MLSSSTDKILAHQGWTFMQQHLLLTPLQLLIYPCVLLHGFVPDMSPCTVIPCSVMQTLYVQACLPSTAQVFHCRSCG